MTLAESVTTVETRQPYASCGCCHVLLVGVPIKPWTSQWCERCIPPAGVIGGTGEHFGGHECDDHMDDASEEYCSVADCDAQTHVVITSVGGRALSPEEQTAYRYCSIHEDVFMEGLNLATIAEQDALDSLHDWRRALMEELVNAGFPGGDRDQITRHVRDLLKLRALVRQYLEGKWSVRGTVDVGPRAPLTLFEMALALYGPGPRPDCPDAKVDSLGLKCDGHGAAFLRSWGADGWWYCPVHGGLRKETVDTMVARARA